MVVLADEILESFFEVDFSATFKLEPVYLDELPSSNSGFLSGLWSNIASNDNKKMFHKLTDEVGRTIGKHQACLDITTAYISFLNLFRFFTDLQSDGIPNLRSQKLERVC